MLDPNLAVRSLTAFAETLVFSTSQSDSGT